MAKKDSQNLGQGDAPSADEIIEALAQEMGVDEAKEEASTPEPEAAEAAADEADAPSAEDETPEQEEAPEPDAPKK